VVIQIVRPIKTIPLLRSWRQAAPANFSLVARTNLPKKRLSTTPYPPSRLLNRFHCVVTKSSGGATPRSPLSFERGFPCQKPIAENPQKLETTSIEASVSAHGERLESHFRVSCWWGVGIPPHPFRLILSRMFLASPVVCVAATTPQNKL